MIPAETRLGLAPPDHRSAAGFVGASGKSLSSNMRGEDLVSCQHANAKEF